MLVLSRVRGVADAEADGFRVGYVGHSLNGMDAPTVFSLLSLALSTGALIISGVVSRRQLKLADNSNVLPVIIETFKETRSSEFSASVEYVLGQLAGDHPADEGYRALPEDAKAHIRRVGLFCDDLGKLVAHGVVDERLVLGAYGTFVSEAWRTMGPYVYHEAARRQGSPPMPYFEDLAARARDTPRAEVHRVVGLRKLPPAG